MAGYTKISDPSAVVGGRRCGMAGAWKAMVLASVLLVGGSIEAFAQDTPNPAKDKVWGGCVLDTLTTVPNLIADIQEGLNISDPGVTVSFVVVYTKANNNNGQPLTTPSGVLQVLLSARIRTRSTSPQKTRTEAPLKETTDIPGGIDGASPADDVDIKSVEEVFILQYKVNGGDLDGDTENRVCHTTDANVDCFRIIAAPVIP